MQNFTPYTALFGGALIGLAATLLLLANGRIAGISGIANGLLARNSTDKAWRIAFIAGLLLGAAAYTTLFALPFTPREGFPLPLLILAGFLVGFGTRLGNGCTSGHGVCGIARLSLRSLVATGVFLTTGILTVFAVTHFTGA